MVASVVLVAVALPATSALDDLKDLVQIHILMRHGQRAPIWQFPGDKTDNSSYWPRGYEHLVKKGLQQQSNLGKWLRQRYSTLLAERGYPHYAEFHVQSSDVERCIDSAIANLASLFPTNAQMEYEKNFSFTPVPVHSVPGDLDDLLNIGAACPKLEGYINEDFYGCDNASVFMSNHSMISDLEQSLNITVESLETLYNIYDTFKIHEEAGLSVPEVFTKYRSTLEDVDYWYFQNIARTDRLKTLRGGGGPLVKKILDDVTNFQNSRDTRKMYMYSAHDSTVATNLNTLNVFNGIPPPYASAVIYEVYNSSGTFNIKVLYQNETADTNITENGNYLANYTLPSMLSAMELYIPGNKTYTCSAAGPLLALQPLLLLALLAKFSLFA